MNDLKVIAEIEVAAEHRAELMPVFEALVKGSRSESGNKQYDFSEDIEKAGHFFVQETWASEAALEEHNGTPHFKAFAAALDGKVITLNITKVMQIF